jgi:glucosamine-6-phosphate deaminase
VSLHLEVFSHGGWAHEVASAWLRFQDEGRERRLCLPTGNTPRSVYGSFADRGGDLGEASVFLLDEFGLPPGDPARCDSMLERDLLARLPNRPRSFSSWDTTAADLDAECLRFEAAVADGGLDLTMLGIGGNGHLALNEPGSAADSASRVVSLHPATVEAADGYSSGPPPSWGVTLGLSSILASRRVWLLVNGAHKADILRAAVRGPVGPDVPASFLQDHPDAIVFADEAAAALL